ncbi:response regulator transcription factor [Furfurilactobacillus rossiae]|uniref:DNA-binding response regulator, CitB family (Rec-wHTH domains) n=1 Tax=Furfurilactobacillus rossiae DSM 15814 TaxID=1114972 RepID=A0A0R1RVJ2_9LACO|nr:response regulator transcription factor [Furfurilactobacillus rossiae]KRL57235.1 DNA-binding response regulator, CitB family (Rec-wHTH domains) [Furfurilactobacillus rossiae DSM 15814]QFR65884.1 response regulator [Furfurilactobacillus rossiae]QLE61296.1 DNA-binding response regulator LuxR [Furfurilactobacillus rossiae]
MIHLYLAEDQGMLNTALTTILNLESDITVVGSAADGQTALNEIRLKHPDIAILDIEMPKLSGLDVADQLKNDQSATKSLILTTFAQPAYFKRALAADVAGYLLKDSPSDDLVESIHKIMAGQIIYAPELVHGMYTASQNPLTKRELEVLSAAQNGASTMEIARIVSLSPGTVRNYMSAVLSKLGAHNRLDAINIAKTNKWL